MDTDRQEELKMISVAFSTRKDNQSHIERIKKNSLILYCLKITIHI